jgi:hypothetical protein
MRANYKAGDLVEIGCTDDWTLCRSLRDPMQHIQECPSKEYEVYSHPRAGKIYESLEGKMGLIVYVKRNLLNQPVGYRVLLEGNEMFCKSKVANKYFRLVGTQNESWRFSKVQEP